MTMFKPNLRVERLQVTARGAVVYDEQFHTGLNIIRGENSSGKSTIMDFIFYGLGGDLNNWRESAIRCDTVFLQVALNGGTATFSREVSVIKVTLAARIIIIHTNTSKITLNIFFPFILHLFLYYGLAFLDI